MAEGGVLKWRGAVQHTLSSPERAEREERDSRRRAEHAESFLMFKRMLQEQSKFNSIVYFDLEFSCDWDEGQPGITQIAFFCVTKEEMYRDNESVLEVEEGRRYMSYINPLIPRDHSQIYA